MMLRRDLLVKMASKDLQDNLEQEVFLDRMVKVDPKGFQVLLELMEKEELLGLLVQEDSK